MRSDQDSAWSSKELAAIVTLDSRGKGHFTDLWRRIGRDEDDVAIKSRARQVLAEIEAGSMHQPRDWRVIPQILRDLRKAGYLDAGPRGFWITEAGGSAALSEVARTMGEDLGFARCCSELHYFDCPDIDTCLAYPLYKKLTDVIQGIFGSVTISQLSRGEVDIMELLRGQLND